jgi:hypothetical protein
VVLCGVWAGLVALLAVRMPLARERVTNAAESETLGDPSFQAEPEAGAPTTS